jgi:predicted Rossmann fold nucleotide-binding protein DprA/Smf involved in DNA uptake
VFWLTLQTSFLAFMDAHHIKAVAAEYPARLRERLGADAPPELTALGNLDLLALPKTALFCSAHCPGSVILPTYDQAAKWRDAGRCVISGFHSPVEKECLQILLRGDAPVILCPARGMLERLPAQWAIAVASGRMLILSAFAATATRITAELATRRNEFVAALADEVYIAHATVGGHLESLIRRLRTWAIPQIHL